MNQIIEELWRRAKERKSELIIFFVSSIVLCVFLYVQILDDVLDRGLFKIYFLNIGQGDSQLFVFPGGAKMLVDGGSDDRKILFEITKALGFFGRRVDIALNTHPQLDHFGGLIDILERYKVSVFISNGLGSQTASYQGLVTAVKESGVREITLEAGDRILYGDSVVEILNPDLAKYDPKKDINESSIVSLVKSRGISVLTTGDIGKNTEQKISRLPQSRDIDILKVAHHGSKNSSGEKFLRVVNPKIAVIQVGKNSYGHPHPATLGNLKKSGAEIYRNDLDGTVEITSDGQKVEIFKLK